MFNIFAMQTLRKSATYLRTALCWHRNIIMFSPHPSCGNIVEKTKNISIPCICVPAPFDRSQYGPVYLMCVLSGWSSRLAKYSSCNGRRCAKSLVGFYCINCHINYGFRHCSAS